MGTHVHPWLIHVNVWQNQYSIVKQNKVKIKIKKKELCKKGFNDLDNHNGVVTHLEPDILQCEVKWALESITMNKTSGGDAILLELFKILKDDAVKVLHSI